MIIKGIITPETKLSDLHLVTHSATAETVKNLIDNTIIGTTCKYNGGEYVMVDAPVLDNYRDTVAYSGIAIKLGDEYELDTDCDYRLQNYGTCEIYQLTWIWQGDGDEDTTNWEFPDKVDTGFPAVWF